MFVKHNMLISVVQTQTYIHGGTNLKPLPWTDYQY